MTSVSIEQTATLAIGEAAHSTRNDKYVHIAFSETQHPLGAEEAWRIHAEGYLNAGFVNESAITEDGFLVPDIDKSRGPNVTYSLAIKPENENDCATMREYHIPPGGMYRDLPAYKLCGEHLWREGQGLLDRLEREGAIIKEITALAKSQEAGPEAIHEVIRNGIHKAFGKNEAWFFGMVSTTFDSLTKQWGPQALLAIGEGVKIEDERVNNVVLRPGLLMPDTFIDSLAVAYQTAENIVDQTRLKRSLLYYTDGLSQDQMSISAFELVQSLKVQAA